MEHGLIAAKQYTDKVIATQQRCHKIQMLVLKINLFRTY